MQKDYPTEHLLSRYQSICRGLDHEATVMNNRITWAILYSAGLFAATALLIPVVSTADSTFARGAFILVIAVVAASGAYFSRSTSMGVNAAQEQFERLVEWYQESKHQFDEMGLVRPFGSRSSHLHGNKAAHVFPRLMFASWAAASIICFVWGFALIGHQLGAVQIPILGVV
ncbi:hypothetical protein [Devosia sp.]|uniref:hypothetical protein n=1 Tax=Devosia sp. TaxID=1871048 RepID=UPI001AD1BE18|nr:hypothetical protein [Devosia sp.]MBN9335281.1 hypothetical protein [Devosia sp.]